MLLLLSRQSTCSIVANIFADSINIDIVIILLIVITTATTTTTTKGTDQRLGCQSILFLFYIMV